jgi:hypothetical protein
VIEAPAEQPRDPTAAAPTIEALRRFHAGRREAAPPPPDGIAPAAAPALAALAAEAGWPLVLAEGEAPLAPARAAVLALADRAARRRLERARVDFAGTAGALAAAAGQLLDADDARRGAPASPRAERYGPLGGRWLEPAALDEVVRRRGGGEPLAPERRRELESARGRLVAFAALAPSPLWVVPPELGPAVLDAPVLATADPCAAALDAFDRAAAGLVPLVAAARRVRLEAAGAFDSARHPEALARLDARGFEASELALVPPVIALVRFADFVGPGLASASRLLRSGRPVQIVALADERDDLVGGEESARLEPALLGVGHREAFVQQGSLARPAELAAGFERGFDCGRPGLHVVDAPAGDEREGPLLAAAARLAAASRRSSATTPRSVGAGRAGSTSAAIRSRSPTGRG